MLLRLAVVMVLLLGPSCLAWGGPEPIPWNPNETYAGDSQYDPRLDKPVQFWGAGRPLPEVFTSIQKQTGVEIGLFPEVPDSGRMCVTLFLNPKRPPTLRTLLTQLGWGHRLQLRDRRTR